MTPLGAKLGPAHSLSNDVGHLRLDLRATQLARDLRAVSRRSQWRSAAAPGGPTFCFTPSSLRRHETMVMIPSLSTVSTGAGSELSAAAEDSTSSAQDCLPSDQRRVQRPAPAYSTAIVVGRNK